MSYSYKKNKKAKRYYIGYRDRHGRNVQEATAARTKAEADRLAEDKERKEERIRLGLEVALAQVTFGEVAAEYLRVRAPAKESGDADAGRLENHILPALGGKYLGEITPAVVQAFLGSDLRQVPRMAREKREEVEKVGKLKPGKPLSPASREQLRVLIQGVFTFAIKQSKVWRGDNPAAEVPRVAGPRRRPQVLEPSEVAAIIAAVDDDLRGMFATAVFTGLRKGELCGLRVEDVDLGGQFLCVERSYDKATTKDKDTRYVPIPDALVPYLKVELGRARSEWLFPAKDGSMRTTDFDAAEVFRTAMKQAGIVVGYDHVCRRKGCTQPSERRADSAPRPCPKCGMASWPKAVPKPYTFKTFRSTYGTLGYEATGDIRFVQHALGHADATTTEHYAKRRNSHMLAQANRLPLASYPALTGAPGQGGTGSTIRSIPQSSTEFTTMRATGIEPVTYGLRVRSEQFHTLTQESKPSLSLAERTQAAVAVSPPLSDSELPSHALSYPALTPVAGGHLLTPDRVAALLSIHRETVYRLVRRGELQAVRIGANLRFRSGDVEAYLAARGSR